MPLKILAFVVLGLVGLLFAGPASAASFDCGKAQTPFEKAICANPDLSHADEVLATAYATALGGLSHDATAVVKSSQKEWLEYANRACTPDAKPATAPYSSDDGACLNTLFDDREKALEQSRMTGGLRLYFTDYYNAAGDSNAADEDDDQSKVATTYQSYSQIDGTDDFARGFNAFVQQNVGKTDNDPPDQQDDTRTLWVTHVDSVRITLEDSYYEYDHGAAHGQFEVTYLHYLRDKQRALKASDVFAKAGWQDRLRQLVTAAVKVEEGDDLMEGAGDAIRDESIDPTHWNFSSQGLKVQFEPYDVAPYSEGAVSVNIPWGALRDDLTDDAQEWATSDAY